MAKYHVNQETGDFGKCTAKPGNCPIGDNEAHFDDREEAAVHSERILAEKYSLVSSMRKENVDFSALKIDTNYPYPEANNLDKVDDFAYSLKSGALSANELSEVHGYVDRVAHYYGDALCYMGLGHSVVGDDGNKAYALNEYGAKYVQSSKEDREKILRDIAAQDPIIKRMNNNEDESTISKDIQKEKNYSEFNTEKKLRNAKAWIKQINSDSFLKDVDYDEFDVKIDMAREAYDTKQHQKKDNGEKVKGELCNSCFIIKPLTGICPNCD